MNERRDPGLATMQSPPEAPTRGEPANRSLGPADELRSRDLGTPGQAAVPVQKDGDQSAPLFAPERAKDFHARWDSIQAAFVDEPRKTVEQADNLVAEVIKHLAQSFADERSRLEQQWSRGEDVSTEELRLALRHHRSFFDRLLSV